MVDPEVGGRGSVETEVGVETGRVEAGAEVRGLVEGICCGCGLDFGGMNLTPGPVTVSFSLPG